jgi:DNA polymerase-3 subunit epsilon
MYAIIDLETTGSHRSANRITEIALYVFDGERVVDSFETLIDPECRIPPFIQNLTGINDEMVRGKPKFYEVAEQVHRMTEGCVFVAHNVGFDYNVLRKEFASLGFSYVRKKLCTVRLARKAFPGHAKYSLGNICAARGINIEARHRAAGDAKATVELFKQILEADQGKWVPEALHHRSKEGSLPLALHVKEVDGLPSTAGIYYFKDSKGKVIYVGKAIDIKSRVMSHFYNKERKDRKMHDVIAHVDHMECGSELMALLVESAEIKRLYPLYNSAQKRQQDAWCIFNYTDQQGITHLGYAKRNQVKDPLLRFYSINQCRGFLETLQETFDLCPRYVQLQGVNGACFHHRLKKCKGVCAGKEEVFAYNDRVYEAIASMGAISGSFIIYLSGRHEEETGFVLVENGLYQGYGYLPCVRESVSLEEVSRHLIPQSDNSDIQRLLRSYFRRESQVDVYELESPLEREGQFVLSLF